MHSYFGGLGRISLYQRSSIDCQLAPRIYFTLATGATRRFAGVYESRQVQNRFLIAGWWTFSAKSHECNWFRPTLH